MRKMTVLLVSQPRIKKLWIQLLPVKFPIPIYFEVQLVLKKISLCSLRRLPIPPWCVPFSPSQEQYTKSASCRFRNWVSLAGCISSNSSLRFITEDSVLCRVCSLRFVDPSRFCPDRPLWDEQSNLLVHKSIEWPLPWEGKFIYIV